MKTIQKLIFLLMLWLASNTFLKAQPGGTCPSPDTLTQVANGGPFTNIVWQTGQLDYYLVFTATNDSLDFDIDTNVVNPAHLSQMSIIASSCFGTMVFSHVYSGTESIMATGLIPGQLYYIKLERTISGDENTVHNLKVRSESKAMQYCWILETPTGSIMFAQIESGDSLIYIMPPLTLPLDCNEICIHPCGTEFAPVDTHYIWSINGPGINLTQDSLVLNGGCFSLPDTNLISPSIYNISVYFMTDTTLFFSTTITLDTSATIPPLGTNPGGPYCSYQDFLDDLTNIIINGTYYPDLAIELDGEDLSLIIGKCSGTYSLHVTGTSPCGAEQEVFDWITILPPTIDISTISTLCATVSFNANTTCTSEIDSIVWDFGDCTGITSTGFAPVYNYAFVGHYLVTATEYDSCGSRYDTMSINIKPPTGDFITYYDCKTNLMSFSANYNCIGLIQSTVWNFGDGTGFTGLYPPDHTYPSIGTYNATLTYTYYVFNAATCDTNLVVVNLSHPVTVLAPVGVVFSGPTESCYTTLNYAITPFSGTFTSSTVSIIPSTAATIVPGPLSYTYVVTVTDPYAAFTIQFIFDDSNGCHDTATFTVQPCCVPVPTPSPTVYVVPPGGSNYLSSYLGSAWWPGTTVATTTLSSISIYIYEDVLIDVNNFEFGNCTLYVYPSKKLEIKSGYLTKIKNLSVLRNMCDQMWYGIYIPDESTTLDVHSSYFRQAENAIVSNKGGVFNVEQVEFRNCYKGILVQDYPSAFTHNGFVIKSTFISVTGALLAPHFSTTSVTYAGIEINGVSTASVIGNIHIGNSSSVSFANNFNNMNYGIKCHYYDLITENCNFKNIITGSGFVPDGMCPKGTAVCVTGAKSMGVDATIGGLAVNQKNSFLNCFNGVNSINFVTLYADMNDFKNIQKNGILCENNYGQTIKLNENNFKSFDAGIRCRNNTTANITLTNNTFNNGIPFIGVTVGNVAIMFDDIAPGTKYNATVQTNAIKDVRNGIWVRNAAKQTVYNINSGNVVHYGVVPVPSATNICYGIRLENCNGVTVQDNTIYRGGTPGAAAPLPSSVIVNYLTGISTENSGACWVKANNIYKMGQGIFVYGNCVGTFYICNNLERCFSAVNFLNANISDQYPGFVPQRNKYIANAGPNKLTGIIVSFPIPNWNYLNIGNESIISSSATPLNYNPVSLGKDICSSSTLLPLAETREVTSGDVVRNTKTYSTNANEFKHWDKKHAYLHLHTNPTELSLGLPTDTEFQDFYSQELDSATGKLQTVYDFIEADDLSNANLTNTNLVPEDAQESNSKTVNQIWLKFLAGDTLNTTDSISLNTIAWSDPFLGGEAVYSARVILDIDPSLSGSTRSFENFEQIDFFKSLNNALGIIVYPNPANEVITIELDEISEGKNELLIFDATGRVVLCKTPELKNHITIDKFSNGIYLIALKNKGQITNQIKFNVQH